MSKLAHFVMVSSIALAAMSAASAQAQTAPAKSDDNVSVLEDVVVTAQRRSERLQDVPVAVTSVEQKQLSALAVESAVDLRLAAPSLNSAPASGYVANSIRGVGSFGFSPGLESPVALYIDGVYLAAPQASELALNNIASVEVLKGPQGTLFGRNATGGLLQITTKTPDQDFEGDVHVGYGNLNTVTLGAYVSGGVAKNLAADIAVSSRTRDGFGTNRFNGAEVGRVAQDFTTRSKWVWTPSMDTTVTAIGNYWRGKNANGWAVGYPGLKNGFNGQINPDLGWDADTNVNVSQRGWSGLGALKIEHDFGPVSFLSTTAYRKGVLDLQRDLDYTRSALVDLDLVQRDKQFSQEFQFTSAKSGPLNWTAGLFYWKARSGYDPVIVDLRGFAPVGLSDTVFQTQESLSYAGYGQATYALTPATNVTLGARYTTEKRTAFAGQELLEFANGFSLPLTGVEREVKASQATYRVSLDHRFNEDILGYLSFNTGFKSGGFNAGGIALPAYDPENLTAYEAGVKADLFDRRFRLNVAGFFYKYDDIQVQRTGLSALIVFNGAAAEVYGIDADFTAILTDKVRLVGGFNWLDTKFKKFDACPLSTPGGGVPLQVGNCAGNKIPFAADFTGSVALTYTTDLAGGELTASTNVYYNSGYAFESDNYIAQDGYATLGASLKWKAEGGVYVNLFGRNLTNERTLGVAGSQVSGNVSASWADPRTYGVTVGYEF